jgi:hypothetical protein
MSKKTRRSHKRHIKRHRTHKRHIKRHTRRHLYRKRREIVSLPGSKGLPLFTIPQKHNTQKILVNQKIQSGNMIPGLRNM